MSRTLAGLELGQEEVLDLGLLELTRGALLEIALERGEDEAALRDAWIQLVAPDGALQRAQSFRGGVWRSEQLPPGLWRARVAGATFAAREVEVTLVAGERRVVTVELLEPGTTRRFAVEGLKDGESFSIEVLGLAGPRTDPVQRTFGSNLVLYGLTPGTWRVVERSASGRIGEASFSIGALDPLTGPPGGPLPLMLR